MVWSRSVSNELSTVAPGVGNRVAGSSKIFFISKSQVPQDRKVTYGRIVCEIKPHKAETHRTRISIGINLIDYPGEVTTPTADIKIVKTLISSTIPTPDARFLCVDVIFLNLSTPMKRYTYMKILFDIIPQVNIY